VSLSSWFFTQNTFVTAGTQSDSASGTDVPAAGFEGAAIAKNRPQVSPAGGVQPVMTRGSGTEQKAVKNEEQQPQPRRMRMKTRTSLTMLTVVGMLAGVGAAAGEQARNQGQGAATASPTTVQLTTEETQNILHMREEEKLARDVYLTFAEMYDCPIFTNIADSEKRHMAAVGLLIGEYGLTDPVTDDTIGVFTEPALTSLYTSLTESGANSLLDALQAGVEIEELDIADLEKALAATNKTDIQWVFGNLLRGSYNHLSAFTRNIEAGGTSCLLQGACGGGGNGPQCAGYGAGFNCGRGGKGRRNGQQSGNGGQRGICQRDRQQNADGSCLLTDSSQS
jgi:hypothetical protein